MDRYHHGLAWPRTDNSDLVVCHFCDALHHAPRVQEGDAAVCGCCGETLFQNRPRSLAKATAYSAACLIFMVIVHSFPFMTMKATSLVTTLTLWESAVSLAQRGNLLLAGAVIFFTIIAPFGLAASMLYVAAPLRFGKVWPGAVRLTRWLQFFQPWSMLEVFFLGLLVSLLKLGHLAELHFGVGLYALAALVFCLAAALSGIDRLELWDRLEVALAKKSS